jgi:hypothetical protein
VRRVGPLPRNAEEKEYFSVAEKEIDEWNAKAMNEAAPSYEFHLLHYDGTMLRNSGRALTAGIICSCGKSCRNINFWIDKNVAFGAVARAVVRNTLLDAPDLDKCGQ